MSRTLTINKTKSYPSLDSGWHTVTIKSARYGDYNGNKFIDINFDSYPENLKLRVYESVNKTTKEEWRIGQLFRFANAGISGGLEGANGSVVMKIDDDANNLRGKEINVYFYKKGDYTEVYRDISPTVFENDVESFNENDVAYWKGRAEKNYVDYNGSNVAKEDSLDDGTFEDPF
jgi:hypothetical protein